jgi:P4 family phage/plasmid primase-like protien
MSDPAHVITPPGRCIVTAWSSLKDSKSGTYLETTWDEWFSSSFSEAKPYQGDMRHPGWSAAIFEPCERAISNVAGLSALVLDYDDGGSIESACEHWGDFYGLIHVTRKHTPDAPRFRIILPFTRVVTPDDYVILWRWAHDIAKAAGHTIDPAPKDISRFWYLPGMKSDAQYEHRRFHGHAIDPNPIIASAQLAPTPTVLANVLPFTAPTAPTTSDPATLERRAIAYLARMAPAVAGQHGHDAAWGAALAVVRGFRLDNATAFRVLAAYYNPRCSPPWSADELRHKVESAAKDGRRPLGYLADRVSTTPTPAQRGTGTDGPAPAPTVATDPKPQLKLGDHVEIAERTLARLETPTAPMTFDDGAFWRYDPAIGIWSEVAVERVESEVTSFSGGWIIGGDKWKPLQISRGTCKGVQELIRNTLTTRMPRTLFANARPGVAFKDCFVTVEGGVITRHAHAPEHLARAGLPFDYDPLEHPELDRFFADLFEKCADADARIALLQEFVGACLLGMAPSYQRCLVLFGTGNNGKSQVIDICKAPFPDGTVVALPPQQWEERFRLPLLVGALANFVGELPNREIAASETFKGIVVGDAQTAERKNRDAFTFSPRAGHMFGANGLPTSGDISAGFFRRFVILPLTKVFPEDGAGVERDIGKRIAREERQAIAAWAVEGAARLQRQGGYTIPPSVADMKAEWTVESDSVALFLRDECRRIPKAAGTGTAFKHIYQAYVAWAKGLGLIPCSGVNFGRRYTQAGYEKATIDGKARYYVCTLESLGEERR